MRFLYALRIVFFVALKIIFRRARGFYVWLSVKFVLNLAACRPGIDHAGTFLHVVLDLHAFAGPKLQLAGVDLVAARLSYEGSLDDRRFAGSPSLADGSGGSGVDGRGPAV